MEILLYKIGIWIVNPNELTITSEKRNVKLTSLCMTVLICLIEHNGQIVSKEKLIKECWNGRFVSDDAVRQVVKELRNYLGCNSKEPSFIETIRKQGYRLLPETIDIKSKKQYPEQIKITLYQQLTTKPNNLLFSAIGLFFIFFSIYLFAFDESNSFQLSDDFTIVTFDKELESVYVSSSLNWDAYVLFKAKTTKPEKIIVRNEEKQIIHEIFPANNSEESYVHLPRFSPDGKQLAYLDYSANNCKIKVISVDGIKIEGLNAISCTKTDGYVAIEWKDNQSIYFSTSESMAIPLSVKLFDLSTNELIQITNPSAGGRGDHYVRVCSNGDTLILRSTDWSSSQLVIYNPEIKKETLNKTIPGILYSADWSESCDKVILAIENKPLTIYDLASDQFSYIEQLKEITFIDENNGHIYLTQGNWFRSEISLVNINTKSQKAIVSSNRNNYQYAKKTDSNYFAFVSTRTGLPQLWLSTNNEDKQLTFFTKYIGIKSLTWSLNGDKLVYIADNQIYQFVFANNQISLLFSVKGNISSVIPLDQSKWIYSTFVNGNWLAYLYDEQDSSINLHSNLPIQKIIKNFDNEIYFSTASRDIYRYEPNTLIHNKISVEPTSIYSWQAVKDRVYFLDFDHNIFYIDAELKQKRVILKNFDVNSFLFIDQENIVFTKNEDGEIDVKKYKYYN
jgi:DNA-binding winged helix-turn-helix (wHTH) protein/Tol biopolymer transport system component